MKRIILVVIILVYSFSVKAQNETVNGNLTVTGATNSKSRIEIKADNGAGHVASRLYLESHNNSRGAGIFSLGQTNKWFMGNPYTDHANAFMIGVAPNTISTDAVAQKQYAKFYVRSNGNVGIGTTSPNEPLEVGGTGRAFIGNGGGASRRGILLQGNGAYSRIVAHDYGTSQGLNLILQDSGGNVGIGTTSPGRKLDVNGTFHVKGYSYLGGADLVFGKDSGRDVGSKVSQRALVHNTLDRLSINYAGDFEGGVHINGPKTIVDGKVGIGTTTPDAKLTVKGNIHTQEVKVDLNGAVAPDYVFKEDYKLKSLDQVQAYINKNGHLPNIPSAAEMEKEGVLLKEMNLKLLEKIEELTLYTLEQQKEIELERTKNRLQEQRLAEIEKLLELKNN